MPAKAKGSGAPSDMKVTELKEELKKRGLPTGGLKADLVARLEEALAKEEGTEATSATDRSTNEDEPSNTSDEAPIEPGAASEANSAPGKNEKLETTAPVANAVPTTSESREQTTEQGENSEERMEVDQTKEDGRKRKTEEAKSADLSPSQKRARKWGTGNAAAAGAAAAPATLVSTETLQAVLGPTKEETPAPASGVEAAKPSMAARPFSVKKPDAAAAAPEPETREVPPSQNPVSRVLFVKNFVRPFTKPSVQKLLEQFGKIVQWDMDTIRSKLFVIFETDEEATATREALHNLVWPPANKSKLHADYATEDEARRFFAAPNSQPPPAQTPAQIVDQRHAPAAAVARLAPAAMDNPNAPRPDRAPISRQPIAERISRAAPAAAGAAAPSRAAQPASKEENAAPAAKPADRKQPPAAPAKAAEPPPPPVKTLDELFRKTVALPAIYYLPVSDEQAAKRKATLPGSKAAASKAPEEAQAAAAAETKAAEGDSQQAKPAESDANGKTAAETAPNGSAGQGVKSEA